MPVPLGYGWIINAVMNSEKRSDAKEGSEESSGSPAVFDLTDSITKTVPVISCLAFVISAFSEGKRKAPGMATRV